MTNSSTDYSIIESVNSTESSQTIENDIDFKNQYIEDYNEIVNLLKDYNTAVDTCGQAHRLLMSNTISEIGDINAFSKILQIVRLINGESDFDNYCSEPAIRSYLYVAWLGEWWKYEDIDPRSQTIKLCIAYNTSRGELDVLKSGIADKMAALRSKYEEVYSNEIAVLNNWVVESQIFHEEMFNFTKSYINFNNDYDSLSQSISRLLKLADIH